MTAKTIGITGAAGFIGQHLAARVARQDDWQLAAATRETFASDEALDAFVGRCDIIVHLAAMNRGVEEEIYRTNTALAHQLVASLDRCGNRPHVIYSSSTQQQGDHPYGKSKREAGEALAGWATACGAPLSILIIPNVYGAGCRPHYNSVVATFCHQLAHGEQPTVQQDKEVDFICVSELVDEIVDHIQDPPNGVCRDHVLGTSRMTVRGLLKTLESFHDGYFKSDVVPDLSDTTRRNLYATFLSYVEPDDLCHRPQLHTDDRGSLVEVIKLAQAGQVFFSTTRPGVVRGNHYHTRKVEWFCVLRGEAVIRLRRVGGQEIREYRVSGERPESISIPVMHIHNIENVGDDELLTMFWCNEIFNAADADTYYEKVA